MTIHTAPETPSSSFNGERARALIRFNAQHITILCPLGHVLESRAIDSSYAGSMFEAELGRRYPGDRFDRMAARCQGAGHQSMVVPAEVHSDDYSFSFPFDAQPWLEVTTPDEMREIYDSDWQEIDIVPRVCARTSPEIQRVLDYVDEIRTNADAQHPPMGFGCSINRERALAWIREHRPDCAPENC